MGRPPCQFFVIPRGQPKLGQVCGGACMEPSKSTLMRQALQRQREGWLRQRALETSGAALRKPLGLDCPGNDQKDLEQTDGYCAEVDAGAISRESATVAVDSTRAQQACLENAVEIVSHLGGAAAHRVTQQLRHELHLAGPCAATFGVGERCATSAGCVRCNSNLLVHVSDANVSHEAPMLLVPCGHSLCARCASQTSSKSLVKCPGCWRRVEGRVVNRPLMQLVAARGQRSSFDNAGIVDHQRVATMDGQLSLRIQLFQDEQFSAETDVALLEDRCQATRAQLLRLTVEEDSLSKAEGGVAEMCRERETELAKAQKADTELETRVASLETVAIMVEATLTNLRRDRAKCKLMVEHFGPHELLDDLVEA